mmetsp:Transcript_107930/g.344537  ORF Transcript_107930/g.344537 Transcript_107930/m.344537 type:complete len:435 (-) Transcript_107930:2882-4186(-)
MICAVTRHGCLFILGVDERIPLRLVLQRLLCGAGVGHIGPKLDLASLHLSALEPKGLLWDDGVGVVKADEVVVEVAGGEAFLAIDQPSAEILNPALRLHNSKLISRLRLRADRKHGALSPRVLRLECRIEPPGSLEGTNERCRCRSNDSKDDRDADLLVLRDGRDEAQTLGQRELGPKLHARRGQSPRGGRGCWEVKGPHFLPTGERAALRIEETHRVDLAKPGLVRSSLLSDQHPGLEEAVHGNAARRPTFQGERTQLHDGLGRGALEDGGAERGAYSRPQQRSPLRRRWPLGGGEAIPHPDRRALGEVPASSTSVPGNHPHSRRPPAPPGRVAVGYLCGRRVAPIRQTTARADQRHAHALRLADVATSRGRVPGVDLEDAVEALSDLLAVHLVVLGREDLGHAAVHLGVLKDADGGDQDQNRRDDHHRNRTM